MENTSTNPATYFEINRWIDSPQKVWSTSRRYLQDADSIFSFTIEADPKDIQEKWSDYWHCTNDSASIFGNNCAVAAQWFLTEFCNIPNPNLSNVSLNHLALGIV